MSTPKLKIFLVLILRKGNGAPTLVMLHCFALENQNSLLVAVLLNTLNMN